MWPVAAPGGGSGSVMTMQPAGAACSSATHSPAPLAAASCHTFGARTMAQHGFRCCNPETVPHLLRRCSCSSSSLASVILAALHELHLHEPARKGLLLAAIAPLLGHAGCWPASCACSVPVRCSVCERAAGSCNNYVQRLCLQATVACINRPGGQLPMRHVRGRCFCDEPENRCTCLMLLRTLGCPEAICKLTGLRRIHTSIISPSSRALSLAQAIRAPHLVQVWVTPSGNMIKHSFSTGSAVPRCSPMNACMRRSWT